MNHILRVFNFTTERNVTNSKFYTDNFGIFYGSICICLVLNFTILIFVSIRFCER